MTSDSTKSLFYIICPIGFEKYLIKELEYKWRMHFKDSTFTIVTIDKGGIEIECLTNQGLHLNLILKTANKILLRIKTQKCRDIPKLYNIMKKIPWKSYINHEEVQINVTASKSRLIHTDKIQKAALGGVNDYFNANKISQKVKDQYTGVSSPEVLLRLSEDNLTISLNTSGELLHIRGEEAFRGHAPLRSTIAATLLIRLLGLKSYSDFELVDPMCGTGTLLKEASNFMKLNDKRTFAFQSFNSKIFTPLQLDEQNSIWNFNNYHGFDIDQEIIKEMKHSVINFSAEDLLKADLKERKKRVIIINPPYGKRVKIEGNKIAYFKGLIQKVKEVYSPNLIGIIIPVEYSRGLQGKKIFFNQNGIKVTFLTESLKE